MGEAVSEVQTERESVIITALIEFDGSFRSAKRIAKSSASKTGVKSGSLKENDQPSGSEKMPTPAFSLFTEASVAIMLFVCTCAR